MDGDTQLEIVTGGGFNDGTRANSQLCVWTGATLALEDVTTWYWTEGNRIESVAIGNVDGDAAVEIVTGGYWDDGTRNIAQLCVWNGATVALENVKTWLWGTDTIIESVAVDNVDSDANLEIVTGGRYYDGSRWIAQLCVWNGATVVLENVETWYWGDDTYFFPVAVGNVDTDANVEIVTGGYYDDITRNVAQLCIWG